MAKTQLEIVLEYFCENEVGLRIILSKKGREGEFGLRKFLSKKPRGRRKVGLRIICPKKKENENKIRHVRRGLTSPVR